MGLRDKGAQQGQFVRDKVDLIDRHRNSGGVGKWKSGLKRPTQELKGVSKRYVEPKRKIKEFKGESVRAKLS